MALSHFQEFVQDERGNKLTGASALVTAIDGTSVTIYADRNGIQPIIGSTVATDGNGKFDFYAPAGEYKVTLSKAGYQSIVLNDLNVPGFEGGADLSALSIASPDDFEGATDTLKIQAALDSLKATGGAVWLAARAYAVTNLTVWNNVCLIGVSSSVTSLSQDPTAAGPVILSYPWIGSSTAVGAKHILKDFRIDGNLAGAAKAKCTITPNSATLTAVDSFTGLAVGYYVEGVGIPEGTTCTAFNALAGTITLSTPVVNKAQYAGTNQKILFRQAFTVTATANAGSKVLTVTAGDMSSIKAGMMASGVNLEVDEDDLSAASRVAAVNQGAHTITLDRAAKTNGSFSVTCYISNDGILCAEPFYNPGYNNTKDYRAPKIDGVQVSQVSGNGLCVRPGRNQVVLCNESKLISSGANGLKMTNSNDSKVQGPIGIGTSWRSNVDISSSSTCRITNFDIFDPQQPDKYPNMSLRGLRQFTLSHGDLNGDLYVKGRNTEEPNHGIRFSHVNFKWHTGDGYPDLTFPQFAEIVNCQAVVDNCYFYGDKDGNCCPNRLLQIDGATVQWFGSRLVTSDLEPTRPYKIEIYHTANGGKLVGYYYDGTLDRYVHIGDNRIDGALVVDMNPDNDPDLATYSFILGGSKPANFGNRIHRESGTSLLPGKAQEFDLIANNDVLVIGEKRLRVNLYGNNQVTNFTATLPDAPDDGHELEIYFRDGVKNFTLAMGDPVNHGLFGDPVPTVPPGTLLRLTFKYDTAPAGKWWVTSTRNRGLDPYQHKFQGMTNGGSEPMESGFNQELHLTRSSLCTAFTVTLPPNPMEGERRRIRLHQGVTAWTLAPNTGQVLNSTDNWPTTIPTGGFTVEAVFHVTSTPENVWYLTRASA